MNRTDTPPTREKILQALESGNRADRDAALWYLRDDADASFLPHLHTLVKEQETPHDARFSAAAGIVRLEGVSYLAHLIETLGEAHRAMMESGEHAPAYEALLDALWKLLHQYPLETQRIARGLLRDERADVRAFAAFLFGGNGEGSAAPLLPLLRDPDPFVRQSAVSAASGFGHDAATVPALIPLLRDEDENVRLMAATVLADLGDKQAVPALQQAAGDPSRAVRNAATHARRRLDGTQQYWRWLLAALVVLGIALAVQVVVQ